MTEQTTADGTTHVSTPTRPAAGLVWSTRLVTLALVALLSVVVPLLAMVDLALPGRPVLAVVFMVLVPGVPVALALRLRNLQATMALALAVSLSYQVIFGTFAVADAFWHPIGSAWIATVIGLGFTVIALRQKQSRVDRRPIAWGEWMRAVVDDRVRLVSLAVILVALLMWWWETRTIVLADAAAYGLFQVISWRFVTALILLAAVTAYTLFRTRCDHLVLTLAAALWALVGYGTVPVSDGHGNVPTGWVHVAFIQYISLNNGGVPSSYDARFSWPGFFSAAAQLVSLSGTDDARSFLVLAPFVYFLLALPGLLLIGHSITHSWRWTWVAVFVYQTTNWYQQDYFAPQATAFVMYVTLIGVLLWMIDSAVIPRLPGNLAAKIVGALRRTPALPVGMSPRTAQGLGLVLAVICAGVVLVHQLTPITLIFALVGFTITGLIRYRMLWLTTGLIFAGYFSFGASDYWLGHLNGLLGDVGQVSNAISAGVGGRIVGDATYQSNQYVRIGWSLLLLIGGAIGVWTIRRRREALLLAGLACAPFALLVVQSYGGEVVIRCFLYASPILAPLTAAALRGGVRVLRSRLGATGPAVTEPPTRTSLIWTAALVPVVVVAGLMLTFTRGLNASFERTPDDQAVAAQLMYDRAVTGDTVALPLFYGLTPYLRITDVRVRYITGDTCTGTDLTSCLKDPLPRFVLIGLTQERAGELTRSRPVGWVWAMGEQLIDSGRYARIYSGADAWLLELNPEGGA
ncbi:MAG: serine/threonine protein kinase [Nakamurella sp.]